MSTEAHTILWRRLDQPGTEAAALLFRPPTWSLEGTVVVEEGGRPCRLDYAVVCDTAWHTLWARVNGWVGLTPVVHRVSRSTTGRWRHNGIERPDLDGCIDVDLAFTPSTNLIPIRRLSMPVGGSASVLTAWLRFPEFTFEVLSQVYHREGEKRYRYESDGGQFTAQLDVNDAGLITRYGDLWSAESR